jgi:hypothetical protein
VASHDITLSLSDELMERAQREAARHGQTVDAFIQHVLEEKLDQPEQTRRAIRRFLALSEQGPLFTGDPRAVTRDELHERR